MPFEGVDTILEAFERNVKRIPDAEFLGTRVDDHYEWLTFKQVKRNAFNFAAGCAKLELIPSVKADGKDWRFMAIQSKNRFEWITVHLANMYNNCTTVALYDTLGVDATRYIADQTKLTTVSLSVDLLERMLYIKLKDIAMPSENRMLNSLQNIVTLEKVLDQTLVNMAKEAGINIYSYADVIEAGIEFNESVNAFTP